jgi:hypothetical protein
MSGRPMIARPVPRGRLRADLVYLGWQHAAAHPDPGPMPVAPPPRAMVPLHVPADWLAAQRREQNLLARPSWLGAAAGGAVACAAAAGWLATPLASGLALILVVAGAATAAACLWSVARGERALRAQVRAERARVRQIAAAAQAQLAAAQELHARAHREWLQRDAAFRRQPHWRPAALPVEVSRVDVAGGTLAGWSALLTMLAAPRLAVGGEVIVLDLTEGAVASDLLALASTWGISPLVWVLPADLPRLDLGLQLPAESLADVLALTAAAAGDGHQSADGHQAGDTARDAALLGRVLDVLGPAAGPGQLTAALRALAQVGGPREQLSDGALTAAQVSALSTMFGRGAQQFVIDRAWALEARLRVLGALGTALSPQPASPLRVAWADRRGTAVGNRVLGSYLAIALTAALRQAPAGLPWQQTVCLLGAERLPADVLDRLCDAAETARAGLVLGYRSLPPAVRDRLGRGNAAVAFMRLGNAADARAAAEQIGSEHRFVVSQLTDTVGSSVTDTAGDSYTSTVGTADSVADSLSRSVSAGRGRSQQATFAPFGPGSREANRSLGLSDSRSVTEGISASTSWGWNTSRAIGTNSSLAGSVQRSRELVVEPHELQHLPQTALVLCHDGPRGREVILADANPAIMTLPATTLATSPDAAITRPRPARWPGSPGPTA